MKTEGLESLLFTSAPPRFYATERPKRIFGGSESVRERFLKSIEEIQIEPNIMVARQIQDAAGAESLDDESPHETLHREFQIPTWFSSWLDITQMLGSKQRQQELVVDCFNRFPLDVNSDDVAIKMASFRVNAACGVAIKGPGSVEIQEKTARFRRAFEDGDLEGANRIALDLSSIPTQSQYRKHFFELVRKTPELAMSQDVWRLISLSRKATVQGTSKLEMNMFRGVRKVMRPDG